MQAGEGEVAEEGAGCVGLVEGVSAWVRFVSLASVMDGVAWLLRIETYP